MFSLALLLLVALVFPSPNSSFLLGTHLVRRQVRDLEGIRSVSFLRGKVAEVPWSGEETEIEEDVSDSPVPSRRRHLEETARWTSALSGAFASLLVGPRGQGGLQTPVPAFAKQSAEEKIEKYKENLKGWLEVLREANGFRITKLEQVYAERDWDKLTIGAKDYFTGISFDSNLGCKVVQEEVRATCTQFREQIRSRAIDLSIASRQRDEKGVETAFEQLKYWAKRWCRIPLATPPEGVTIEDVRAEVIASGTPLPPMPTPGKILKTTRRES
uniref:Uncharacterized protein n=1 Tax=Chromera velia CCMP2878 TaxID=1169474 RepID=A0A0G4IC87_9ALVE|eukprot:Cvel_13052.t1-p1 / transcript=Cvel_13052.t1 / gene=Cvel_13052 / organism=Chromera_velia_CCMP2878 / gene_product=hypothetical protein / transcript_product=hypothetical protein / location=Cvel_scaffold878:28770-29582(+) / protein_length=271 / sequence_SO=supercontig / SO=protein_coding / is_pseudo=false